MKKTVLFVLLAIHFAAFGQTPDQQSIPSFVLKGKSAGELRIMRNEIFARYGYIFKSEDLAAYFATRPWYKPEFSNIDTRLTATDKANIEKISKFENLARANPLRQEYANESKAYFRIVTDAETGDQLEKSRDVTFHDHCKFGTIKKTVERTYFGGEAVPTVVYAETSEPSRSFWETTKYFNDIEFSCSYFRAINYGCCGSEDYNELFNYVSDEPFLKFNEEFFLVDIPNSKIEMFVGYSHKESGREELGIATLYLSTLDGVVSSVTFTAKNAEDKEDMIWYFTPKISLRTSNGKNKINSSGKKIQLWESNSAKSTSDVNGFSIYIEFEGEGTGRKAEFDIPVVNGKLYGSDEPNTEIVVDLK